MLSARSMIQKARRCTEWRPRNDSVLRESAGRAAIGELIDPKLRESALSYFALEILQDVLDGPPGFDGWVLSTIRQTSYFACHSCSEEPPGI